MVWTCDDDGMNKCMEFRVEGRRPRRTWLESVEADMAEEDMTERNGERML